MIGIAFQMLIFRCSVKKMKVGCLATSNVYSDEFGKALSIVVKHLQRCYSMRSMRIPNSVFAHITARVSLGQSCCIEILEVMYMAHPTRSSDIDRDRVAQRRKDTVQFGNQRCCKASVLVTRRVCRTRLSCTPPQPPADHLSPVKGEFEGR